MPRMGPVINNQAPLTSQKLYYVAIALPPNFTVTNIIFVSATQQAVTPANWWFALLDSTGLVLGVTADQLTAAWAANTAKSLALTAAYTTVSTGVYYLGIMVNAATPPSLFCAAESSTVMGFTGPFGTPYLTQVGGAGLTTPAGLGTTPFSLQSSQVVANAAYAGVS